MKIPHIHAKEIKAWADGATIQWGEIETGKWFDVDCPSWEPDDKFRIKPEPSPDIIRYGHFEAKAYLSGRFDEGYHNIKMTFDGETGKLKSAEVL